MPDGDKFREYNLHPRGGSPQHGSGSIEFHLFAPLASGLSKLSPSHPLEREREGERERCLDPLDPRPHAPLLAAARAPPPPADLHDTSRSVERGTWSARKGPARGTGSRSKREKNKLEILPQFFFLPFLFPPSAPHPAPFFDLFSTSSPLSRPLVRRPPQTQTPQQVIQPINGDPFIGMLETPVTSSPLVASYLSSLPAYRTGVSPLLRGVEIGLAHGLLVTGPFIKLGPLRDAANGVAEKAGCASGAGLVLILTACLAMYGASTFQNEGAEALGVKTLSGRAVARDPLQSGAGWSAFTAGWLVGGLSGVAWAYVLTQVLPYYS